MTRGAAREGCQSRAGAFCGSRFYGDVKVSTGRGKRRQRVVFGGHTVNASKKIANNNKLAVAA